MIHTFSPHFYLLSKMSYAATVLEIHKDHKTLYHFIMTSSFCVHKAIHMLLKCYIECAIQYRKAEPGSTLMALKDLTIKTATRTSALFVQLKSTLSLFGRAVVSLCVLMLRIRHAR